uniref:CSON012951 protein n=1 Tax=Culicoides sonorensis TaxID=179676 RepID=A0A336MIU4_CULSO
MPRRCLRICAAETSVDNCGFDHHTPNEFVRSQWQDCSKSNIFLIYRWLLACFFTSVVIYSIYAHINIYNNPFGYYFIYLTNLGIILCMICTLLGAILVTIWHFHLADKANDNIEMPLIFKIYWSIHNTSMILSLLITLVYWTVIHTPEKPLDVTNFFTHACNSIFMFIDFIIVAHPIRLMHVIWPLLAGLVYGLFTLIYYLAGGVDPEGNKWIYEVLDWSKPGVVMIVVAGIIVVILILHTIMFWIYRLRVYLYKKFFVKNEIITDKNGQTNDAFNSDSTQALDDQR